MWARYEDSGFALKTKLKEENMDIGIGWVMTNCDVLGLLTITVVNVAGLFTVM